MLGAKMMLLTLSIAFLLLSPVCFDVVVPECCSAAQSATDSARRTREAPQQEGQAPTYQGLAIGKSTSADVERVFGKPIWSGPPEEKLIDDDSEDELLYEYLNVGNVEGQTTIVLGARSRLVKAIDVYPRQPLALQKVIEQYGNQYVERESASAPCLTKGATLNSAPPKPREYPYTLVYPQQGMYVLVSKDRKISHIGFLARCR